MYGSSLVNAWNSPDPIVSIRIVRCGEYYRRGTDLSNWCPGMGVTTHRPYGLYIHIIPVDPVADPLPTDTNSMELYRTTSLWERFNSSWTPTEYWKRDYRLWDRISISTELFKLFYICMYETIYIYKYILHIHKGKGIWNIFTQNHFPLRVKLFT